MPTRFTTTATLLSLAFPLALGSAQQARSSIAVSGGVATDQRGVRSSAMTLAPAFTLQHAGSALQLAGNATRFATDVWSVGASGAFATRAPLGAHAALTLDASAGASRLSGSSAGTFASGELLPALEARAGVLTAFAGVRGAAGRVSQPRLATGTPPILGGRPSTSATITASGSGSVLGAVVSIASASAGRLRLGAREDRLRVGGAVAVDRSVFTDVTEGRLALQLSAGLRTGTDRHSFGSGTASLGLTDGLSLELSAGAYAPNLLLGTPAGRYASAGLAVRLGDAGESTVPRSGNAGEGTTPRPRGVAAPRAGFTRLAIRAPRARRVEIAGDFTEWKFVAATRAANGVWYADLRIPPGQYRYAFRVDGTEWRVPDGATAVDDGFGGRSAWITVPDRSRQ